MPYHSLFPRLVYLPGTSAFCNKSVCTGIRLGLFGWTVVRFVRVIRVPACARVSRVCPGSPRCLFTGIRIGLAETNLCVLPCRGVALEVNEGDLLRLPSRRG